MKFKIKKGDFSPLNLMRKLGYHPHWENESFVRLAGRERYPRYHIYLKESSDFLEVSLHFDQKKQSYQGQKAHSGDYQGDLLSKEKERIINILNK